MPNRTHFRNPRPTDFEKSLRVALQTHSWPTLHCMHSEHSRQEMCSDDLKKLYRVYCDKVDLTAWVQPSIPNIFRMRQTRKSFSVHVWYQCHSSQLCELTSLLLRWNVSSSYKIACQTFKPMQPIVITQASTLRWNFTHNFSSTYVQSYSRTWGGRKKTLSPSLCTQKCKVKTLCHNDWSKTTHSRTTGILQSVPNANTTKPIVWCFFTHTASCRWQGERNV